MMDVVHERAAGMDISKRDAKVAVRVPGKRSGSYTTTVKTFGATAGQILALIDYLVDQRVTTVVMEATSDYWKPFYYVMEDPLPVMLVNAKHARNVPGRTSDVSDAAWLAQLGAHGLLRASFVPPEPVRRLRDLTRARSVAARDRARIVQRLEKFLESSGIKLSAVATDLTGVSARAMLEALVAGERDPRVLADLAKRTLRRKIPALVEALQGRFTEHHAFMVSQYLSQLDTQQATIDALTDRIETVIVPFKSARDALVTIPGVSHTVAEVIIAETGADMTVFPTAGHLASWAGVCPGMNESAGRVKSTHTRHGNAHLKAALGVAAMSASRTKGTYLAVRYRRIVLRTDGHPRPFTSERVCCCNEPAPGVPTPSPRATTSRSNRCPRRAWRSAASPRRRPPASGASSGR
jgi:transposase